MSPLLQLITALMLMWHSALALSATVDLGNGFQDHGVATPVSNHRGTVATKDGDGRNVVLLWLFDHRGGYALLLIDAATGKTEQFPLPFPPGGDTPYASILSSKNKFYTHFNSYFVEFDPVARAFTFHAKSLPQMAMSMTEDDQGVIWSVTYPDSGVVSFDPSTRRFTDYGHVYKQNWKQYQRSVAADDAGWLYFGVGNTASQIIAFDPKTSTTIPLVAEENRFTGTGSVVRDLNGKVYGYGGEKDQWYELNEGKSKAIQKPKINAKKIIHGDQSLFHRTFPDGKILKTCDTINRTLEVEDPSTGVITRRKFSYSSEGAHIMGIATAPGGKIVGGTSFPMRFFAYDPDTDRWENQESYRQWNTLARQGSSIYVGGYPDGFLLEWNPAKAWVPTVKGDVQTNPQFITQVHPAIDRPHDLLAHPDGKHVILAGTPGYGRTGGGLLFWNRETKEQVLIDHKSILPGHSTMSLVALSDNKILGGTTTSAGTGGEKQAEMAELYVMDMNTKKIEWHAPVIHGTQSYTDLHSTEKDIVYGIADQRKFFVLNTKTKKLVLQVDTKEEFGLTISQQGPRVFIQGDDGEIYILFNNGIAQIDLASHKINQIAKSPVPIGQGGDISNGRLYFGSGSHLFSHKLPASRKLNK